MTEQAVVVETTEEEGSWLPLILIVLLAIIWWIAYGTGSTSIRIRRWYNMQRIQFKKKLGLRDESIYREFSAGDGASQQYKRQG